MYKESNPSGPAAIACLGRLGRDRALIDGGGSRLLVQHFQGDFGGVFFGIVDILAVVPVAGGDILALDADRAGPGGTTS